MAEAAAKPSLESLRAQREEILRIAARYGAFNVRIFGSVARGDADELSDVDVLVDMERRLSEGGFAYFGRLEELRRALAELLGHKVDVIDAAGLHSMRERVLREAVPL